MSKRNHHKQPNFYLKGFKSSDEGNPKVWVYEKGKPFYDGKTEQLQNPKHLTTEKAARTRDFYAFEKEDGTKDYDKYEDLLRDEFEEPAKPVIEKIRRFEEINESEKILLSKYVASMVTRGDWWANFLETNVNKTKEYMDEASSQTFEKPEYVFAKKGINKFVENFSIGEKKVKIIPDFAQQYLAPSVMNLEWEFLVTSSNIEFLTSDNPVCFEFNINFKRFCFFLISSKICLYCFEKPNFLDSKKWKKQNSQFSEVDDKTVEIIRDKVVKEAISEVYCSQKREWLVKFINNRIDK
jgi:Protein of unknown function (DUF4238)